MGDPDWRIYADAKRSFAAGVPVGIDAPLPRLPAVLRRKRQWSQPHDTHQEPVGVHHNYRLGLVISLDRPRERDEGQRRRIWR